MFRKCAGSKGAGKSRLGQKVIPRTLSRIVFLYPTECEQDHKLNMAPRDEEPSGHGTFSGMSILTGRLFLSEGSGHKTAACRPARCSIAS